MAYRGVIDPMIMVGVRGAGELYVFDDGWVLIGLRLDGTAREKLGRTVFMQGGAVGGAAGGLARGIKLANQSKEIRAEIESGAAGLTAAATAERYENTLLTPLDAIVSARLQKERWKARQLIVALSDGGEQILKFGHKSAAFDLLPPLLDDRWINEMED